MEAIQQLLFRLGIRETYKGARYLCYAVHLAAQNAAYLTQLTTALYPAVAAHFQITVKAAEWALRTVIQAFWLRGNLAYFFEIAGYPLKDRPYTGEFIGTLAAYVRMREPPWPN